MSAPGTSRVESGQHDAVTKPAPSFLVFMNVTNSITHLTLGAVALSAILFANRVYARTSLEQHIYLCVIGYVLLMSQAIMAMNPHNGWAHSLKYQEKKLIHWVMQVMGSILAVTGSIIRIADISDHFESVHAIVGIIAMILTIFSLIGGVFGLFAARMRMNQVPLKIGHSIFGSLTLSVAFLTLILGFNKDIYRFVNGDTNANLSISLAVIALVGTLLSPCLGVIRRIVSK